MKTLVLQFVVECAHTEVLQGQDLGWLPCVCVWGGDFRVRIEDEQGAVKAWLRRCSYSLPKGFVGRRKGGPPAGESQLLFIPGNTGEGGRGFKERGLRALWAVSGR